MSRAADIVWCAACASQGERAGWSFSEAVAASERHRKLVCELCQGVFEASELLAGYEETSPPEPVPTADTWWDDVDSPAFVAQVVTITRDFPPASKTLTEQVQSFLEEANAKTPRRLHRADGFHASELGSRWCGRYAAFKKLLPRPVDGRQFLGALMLRFEMGRAAHHHWQNNVFGKMRILKGTWACSRCTHKVKGFMPSEPCPRCKWPVNPALRTRAPKSSRSKNCADYCSWDGGYDADGRDCALCEIGGSWEFRETFVELPELGIVGKFDGVLLYRGEEVVFEFKTRRSEDFPLTEPKEDHVIQCNVYMRATGIKKGLVVYLNKNTGETVEFPLDPDPRVDQLIEQRTSSVKKAVEEGVLPNGTCSGPRSSDAKVCPYQDVCFLGHDDIEAIKSSLEV